MLRVIAGIGAGELITPSKLIVSDVARLRERGKYQVIIGVAYAINNSVGPVIGGALSSASGDGWRNIFQLNLPLVVFTTLGLVFFMPLKKAKSNCNLKPKTVDFLGIALVLSGTTIFLVGLTWGESDYP
ncbi:hypothetical protein GGS21DRAFT_546520 [Xylaria nigripes]|nr:hypothetical protein GGS21DRAFT_546520 [Xylaria nigripes]